MEERTEHDATLARYLLGNLPADDQDRIEAQALGDPVLFERLQLIEEDLIDAYVHEELAADDRTLFERRFLDHPERRERLEIARCLQTVVDRAAQAEAAPPPRLERHDTARLDADPGSVSWLAWAASLLVLVLAGWLAWQNLHLGERLSELQSARRDWDSELQALSEEQRRIAGELSAEKERAAELESALVAERQRSAELEQRAGEASAAEPQTVARVRPPITVAFILGQGVRSGAGGVPRLAVPAVAERLEIQLAIENLEPGSSFRALIANLAGVEVWGAPLSPSASNQGLTVELPAAVLPPGRYLLTLQEDLDGTFEEVGFFDFEVVQG